jgi:hypothetical protein
MQMKFEATEVTQVSEERIVSFSLLLVLLNYAHVQTRYSRV